MIFINMILLRQILESLEPKILYHGSNAPITKLDASKVRGGARATIGWGVYFSTSKHKASDYGPIMTYMDANKLNILNMDKPVTQEFVDSIQRVSDGMSGSGLGIINKMKVQMFATKFEHEIGNDINSARKNVLDAFRQDHEELFLDVLKRLGYHGVSSGYEYSIFDMDAGTDALIEQ